MFRAQELAELSAISAGRNTLKELELEDCRSINTLDEIECLEQLQFLGVSNCGHISSLEPVQRFRRLEELHAWGSTLIVDGDLSPLTKLSRLREIRMRDRPNYRPWVADLAARAR